MQCLIGIDIYDETVRTTYERLFSEIFHQQIKYYKVDNIVQYYLEYSNIQLQDYIKEENVS